MLYEFLSLCIDFLYICVVPCFDLASIIILSKKYNVLKKHLKLWGKGEHGSTVACCVYNIVISMINLLYLLDHPVVGGGHYSRAATCNSWNFLPAPICILFCIFHNLQFKSSIFLLVVVAILTKAV